MKSKFKQIPKKIWERVSGIEPRRLWAELSNTQKELSNTRQRQNRIHPYVAEALGLVAPVEYNLVKIDSQIGTSNSVFTEFGSDKDTRHSYGEFYFEFLNRFPNPKILEIGVGSVNNFPYAGLPPGGALKAFRKKFSNATIVGVDIDPVSIESVKADGFFGFVVDQTSDESLSKSRIILNEFGPFDLIIDDGFHDPHANVRTLKMFFSLLSEKGTYVIEDVHESLIDFWKTISVHLPGKIQILDMRTLRPSVDDNILILITK